MTTWLDKLNLQPQERRAVLAGLVLLALVFNYWFIWPYFSEWSQVNTELEKAEARCANFRKEIAKAKDYKTRLAELEKKGAGGVLEEDQANRVQATIQTEAFNHNINITRLTATRGYGPTNAFFNEEVAVVDVVAGEDELIGFLHALGSGDSMIRVRDLNNLGLDPSQQRLMAKLSLVASFQKKVIAPPAAAAIPAQQSTAKTTVLPKTNAPIKAGNSNLPARNPGTNGPRGLASTNRPSATNPSANKK